MLGECLHFYYLLAVRTEHQHGTRLPIMHFDPSVPERGIHFITKDASPVEWDAIPYPVSSWQDIDVVVN